MACFNTIINEELDTIEIHIGGFGMVIKDYSKMSPEKFSMCLEQVTNNYTKSRDNYHNLLITTSERLLNENLLR